ncbi:hypothetical protein HJG60_010568 [Phyllostomus discolor]|uniref:Uncharacterized protein n=1 Tax=Phyllostomus discolor TaxID=89673 RepID=A0A834AH51_9CHIR|nr:hypothetical protein HJG60_010568 [Phyllostomus discolor]
MPGAVREPFCQACVTSSITSSWWALGQGWSWSPDSRPAWLPLGPIQGLCLKQGAPGPQNAFLSHPPAAVSSSSHLRGVCCPNQTVSSPSGLSSPLPTHPNFMASTSGPVLWKSLSRLCPMG